MCEPLGTYLRHKTEIDQQSEPTNKESSDHSKTRADKKEHGQHLYGWFTSMYYWFALQHTTKMVLVKVKELIRDPAHSHPRPYNVPF